MSSRTEPARLNIYLDDPDLRRRVRIAAANRGVTLSAYCVAAIEERLATEEAGPEPGGDARAAAAALDRVRRRIGRVGVPVRELIAQGRAR